jgi:hypothetical protein
MVFLETAALGTEKVWKNLVQLSCKENKLAKELGGRESYDRFVSYKNSNKGLRFDNQKLSKNEITKVLESQRKGSIYVEGFHVIEKITKPYFLSFRLLIFFVIFART